MGDILNQSRQQVATLAGMIDEFLQQGINPAMDNYKK